LGDSGFSLRFEKAILKHQSRIQGKFGLLSYSGGIDSSVLLRLLKNIGSQYFSSLFVQYFQHNLRGLESIREEEFVKEQCQKAGIPLFVTSLKLCEEGNLQKQARDLRYSCLKQKLKDLSYELGTDGVILTAHHRDDVYENFLITVSQGRLDQRLLPLEIWDENRNLYRPMLHFSREEILEFAQTNGILWVEDSSNLSQKYLRNSIRHSGISQGLKPVIDKAFTIQSQLLGTDQKLFVDLFSYCEAEDNKISVPRGMLLGLPADLVCDFFRYLCEKIFTFQFELLSHKGLLPIVQKILIWKLAPNSGYAKFCISKGTNKKLILFLTQEWIHIENIVKSPE